MPFRL